MSKMDDLDERWAVRTRREDMSKRQLQQQVASAHIFTEAMKLSAYPPNRIAHAETAVKSWLKLVEEEIYKGDTDG